MLDSVRYIPRVDMFEHHSQAPLIILGCLVGLCILVFFGIVVGLISKRSDGFRGWLREWRQLTRPARPQERREGHTAGNVPAVDNSNQGHPQPQPQAPLELHIMRPTTIHNGEARRGETPLEGGVVWDSYHLMRREEGRGSVDRALDRPRAEEKDFGSPRPAANSNRHAFVHQSGSGGASPPRTVSPSNVWPGHGVGPGN